MAVLLTGAIQKITYTSKPGKRFKINCLKACRVLAYEYFEGTIVIKSASNFLFTVGQLE